MLSLLKLILSTRIWVVIAVFVGMGVLFWPQARTFTAGNESLVLLAEVVILVLATAVTIFSAYEIEGVKSFVTDIIGDVLIWTLSTSALTYAFATGMTDYWLPLVMLATATFFAFFDFLFSLNGGASKLIEMEKGRMGIDP